MGVVRNLPAMMSGMASDVGVGPPFNASGVPGHFTPSFGPPFNVSSWSGKTDYTPMSPTAGPDNQFAHGSPTTFTFSVSPNGGVGPYGYQWYIDSEGGDDPSPTADFSGSTTGSSVTVSISLSQAFVAWGVSVHCDVTDSAAHTVSSNSASCTGLLP